MLRPTWIGRLIGGVHGLAFLLSLASWEVWPGSGPPLLSCVVTFSLKIQLFCSLGKFYVLPSQNGWWLGVIGANSNRRSPRYSVSIYSHTFLKLSTLALGLPLPSYQVSFSLKIHWSILFKRIRKFQLILYFIFTYFVSVNLIYTEI